ncbi:SCO family protein [Rhodovibrionaceae bacterium A322]
MPPFVRAILILSVGLLVLAIGMASWWYMGGNQQVARYSEGTSTGAASIGGPFTLVDQNGQTQTPDSYKGGYMLVYFGYTYCPDVCPTGLQNMTLALDDLTKENPDQADRITPIFITVDPERDTVEELNTYASHFHERLVALTGSMDQVSEAAKNYRVFFQKVQDESSGEYLMDHSSFIFLMDPEGTYITHYTHLTPPDEMAKSLSERVRS